MRTDAALLISKGIIGLGQKHIPAAEIAGLNQTRHLVGVHPEMGAGVLMIVLTTHRWNGAGGRKILQRFLTNLRINLISNYLVCALFCALYIISLGKLAADTNTYKGVVIKYNEPEDARKPTNFWRLYPFKGDEALKVMHIHRQSGYLIGSSQHIVDIPMLHPSISKQHAVLQFRFVSFEKPTQFSFARNGVLNV